MDVFLSLVISLGIIFDCICAHTPTPLLHIGKLRLFHLRGIPLIWTTLQLTLLSLACAAFPWVLTATCFSFSLRFRIDGLTPSYISDLLEPCDAPGPSNQTVRCFRLSLNLELNSDIFCPHTVEQHSNIKTRFKTYFYSLAFDSVWV